MRTWLIQKKTSAAFARLPPGSTCAIEFVPPKRHPAPGIPYDPLTGQPSYPQTTSYPKVPVTPGVPEYYGQPVYPQMPKYPGVPSYPNMTSYPGTPQLVQQPSYSGTPLYAYQQPSYPGTVSYPQFPQEEPKIDTQVFYPQFSQDEPKISTEVLYAQPPSQTTQTTQPVEAPKDAEVSSYVSYANLSPAGRAFAEDPYAVRPAGQAGTTPAPVAATTWVALAAVAGGLVWLATRDETPRKATARKARR